MRLKLEVDPWSTTIFVPQTISVHDFSEIGCPIRRRIVDAHYHLILSNTISHSVHIFKRTKRTHDKTPTGTGVTDNSPSGFWNTLKPGSFLTSCLSFLLWVCLLLQEGHLWIVEVSRKSITALPGGALGGVTEIDHLSGHGPAGGISWPRSGIVIVPNNPRFQECDENVSMRRHWGQSHGHILDGSLIKTGFLGECKDDQVPDFLVICQIRGWGWSHLILAPVVVELTGVGCHYNLTFMSPESGRT